MWLVLRPEHKIHLSQDAFAQAGIDVIGLALQTVLPKDNVQEIVTQQDFIHTDVIIFTSQMAAQLALPFIGDLPNHTYIYAIGKSTFQTLAQWTEQYPFWCNSHQMIVPPVAQQTSEGILQLPSLQQLTGKRALIIKGERGRSTLTDTMTERGAQVTSCMVYERNALTTPIATQVWELDDIHGVVVTSNEQLQLAYDVYPHSWLCELKWIVVSPRIAQYAHALGIPNHNITVTHGADDAALIERIQQLME
jgi:uroporphyrinogen-III synthase